MIKSYFERSVEVELVETKFFPKLKFDAIGSWKMSQKRRQIKVGEETELYLERLICLFVFRIRSE